jgi:hypothetical protein
VKIGDVCFKRDGVFAMELGGPEVGRGCGGRGIIHGFELLEKLGFHDWGFDYVLLDFLGDVVCGGFGLPIARDMCQKVIVVGSNDLQSLYVANNVCSAVEYFRKLGGNVGVAGIVINKDDGTGEAQAFAEAVGIPVLASIPAHDDIRARAPTTKSSARPGSEWGRCSRSSPPTSPRRRPRAPEAADPGRPARPVQGRGRGTQRGAHPASFEDMCGGSVTSRSRRSKSSTTRSDGMALVLNASIHGHGPAAKPVEAGAVSCHGGASELKARGQGRGQERGARRSMPRTIPRARTISRRACARPSARCASACACAAPPPCCRARPAASTGSPSPRTSTARAARRLRAVQLRDAGHRQAVRGHPRGGVQARRPGDYDAIVIINLCVPTASGVPLQLLPKEINGVRIIGIDVPGFGVPTHAEAKDVLAAAMLRYAREARAGTGAGPAWPRSDCPTDHAGRRDVPGRSDRHRPMLEPLGLPPGRSCRPANGASSSALDCAVVAAIHPLLHRLVP